MTDVYRRNSYCLDIWDNGLCIVFVILCGLLLPLCLFTLNNTNEFTSEVLSKLFILSILEDPINYNKAISAITSRSRKFFYYFVADFFFCKKIWEKMMAKFNRACERMSKKAGNLKGVTLCSDFFVVCVERIL